MRLKFQSGGVEYFSATSTKTFHAENAERSGGHFQVLTMVEWYNVLAEPIITPWCRPDDSEIFRTHVNAAVESAYGFTTVTLVHTMVEPVIREMVTAGVICELSIYGCPGWFIFHAAYSHSLNM